MCWDDCMIFILYLFKMLFIKWIDLWIPKTSCIPGINLTWFWFMILLIYCWIQDVSILLRIFTSMFSSDIDLKFFFLWYHCLVLLSKLWWHHKMSSEVFSSVQVLIMASDGEGNGNPLQCSCLENPRDGGAWWAAVYAVAQSRTRLKRQQQQQMDRW